MPRRLVFLTGAINVNHIGSTRRCRAWALEVPDNGGSDAVTPDVRKELNAVPLVEVVAEPTLRTRVASITTSARNKHG